MVDAKIIRQPRIKVYEVHVHGVAGQYRSGDMEIQLPDCDFDVEMRLPNGQMLSFQYRIESPSIDLCMPEAGSLIVWSDDDLTPAKSRPEKEQKHVFMQVKQVCLGLNLAVLGPPEEEPAKEG